MEGLVFNNGGLLVVNKKWIAVLALVLPLYAPLTYANAVESLEYVHIDPAQPVPAGPRIFVQEVFWYGCPHCFHLQPLLNRWLAHKPADVIFARQAAAISPYWLPQARAFFAFKDLGLIPQLHDRFFDAIHIQHKNLNSGATIARWVAAHSAVSAARFSAVYHSFRVGLQLRRARQQQQMEGIHSVPTFVVDGRYRTNPSLAGGRRQLLKIVDYLIHKAQMKREH